MIEMMRQRKIHKLLLGVLAATLLCVQGCQKSALPDCFMSTGEIVKENRNHGYFHAVKLYDNINLHLIPAGDPGITLEAGRNLMGKLETYVDEDSVLIIRNNNRCNWVRSYDKPVNAYLAVRDLRSIEYRSIGDITCSDTIRQDSLRIDVWEGAGTINLDVHTGKCEANIHYGTAVVVLHGITRQGYYYQLGAGKILAESLLAEQVYLRNWGSNDMYAWATKYMAAEIKGLGNVYYRGNPDINASILGEGRLIRLP